MFDDICYKKPYLSDVIARVDFLNPIQGIARSLPRDLSKKAKVNFPIAEPSKATLQELHLSPLEGLKSKETEVTEWNFHGKNRDKTLTIVQNAIFVKYISYESYEALRNDFFDILSSFLDTFKDAQPMRVGLRYVNNITLDEGHPLEWAQYLNENLLYLFRFYPDQKYLSRAFQILELNFGDFNVRCQLGMPNPDYPAAIRRKSFVLDFDAYYQSVLEKDEVFSNFDKFHIKIQELFEMSITERLRRMMNE